MLIMSEAMELIDKLPRHNPIPVRGSSYRICTFCMVSCPHVVNGCGGWAWWVDLRCARGVVLERDCGAENEDKALGWRRAVRIPVHARTCKMRMND